MSAANPGKRNPYRACHRPRRGRINAVGNWPPSGTGRLRPLFPPGSFQSPGAMHIAPFRGATTYTRLSPGIHCLDRLPPEKQSIDPVIFCQYLSVSVGFGLSDNHNEARCPIACMDKKSLPGFYQNRRFHILNISGGKTMVMASSGQSCRHDPQCQHSSGYFR